MQFLSKTFSVSKWFCNSGYKGRYLKNKISTDYISPKYLIKSKFYDAFGHFYTSKKFSNQDTLHLTTVTKTLDLPEKYNTEKSYNHAIKCHNFY